MIVTAQPVTVSGDCTATGKSSVSENEEIAGIYVYICGAVETPGVYELSTAMTTEEMLQIMAAGSSEVSGTDTAAKESADENSRSSDSGEEETTGETIAGEESNGG